MKQIYLEDVKAGDVMPPLTTDPINRVQLVKYAGSSLDFNPLHYDEDFAHKAGLKGCIAHGMLSMGFLGRYAMNWGGPKAFVRDIDVRFTSPTDLGDTVVCKGTVKSVNAAKKEVECEFETSTLRGNVTVKGTAVVRLPSRN